MQINSQLYSRQPFTEQEQLDAFLWHLLTKRQEQRSPAAFLFVESFRTCGSSHKCIGWCPQWAQGRMLYNFTGNTTDYMWCNQWWTMADMERPVVNHYQLPVISFRDTVWPRLSEPRPDLPCLWNGGAHPDELAHILFADVVAYGLMQAMQHSEQHTAASPGECASFVPSRRFYSLAPLTRFCLRKPRGSIDASPQQTPGTFFDVSNPDAFVPHAVSGAWEFREDRPGKPGWVCEPSFRRSVPSNATTAAGAAAATRNDSSHTIWFRVTFSDEPQLQVTYLTTYQNIGAVEVFLYTEAGKSELAAVAPSNHSALAAYQVLRLALIMLHFSWRGAATSSSC